MVTRSHEHREFLLEANLRREATLKRANSTIEVNQETGARLIKGGLGNAAGMDALLVSLCTLQIQTDPVTKLPKPGGRETPVSQAVVDSWPAEMTEEELQLMRSTPGFHLAAKV